MSIDIALHSYSCRLRLRHDPDYDVFAFIRDAAARGYTGVTLSLSGPDNTHHPPHRHLGGDTAGHLAAVRALLHQHGLSVEADTDTVDPTRLRATITLAAQLGARVLRTFTHHQPGPDLLARTRDDLAAVADQAAGNGVVLAVENHEEFTAHELAGLAAELDHPAIRLLFDYANSLPVLEDPHDALSAMHPWIAAAHVKDVVLLDAQHIPERVPATVGVALGDGTIDLPGLTARLHAAGLRRFAVQNSWGYHVPLGKLRPVNTADPRLGHHPFTFTTQPHHSTIHPAPENTLDPHELMSQETHALDRATTTAHHLVHHLDTTDPTP